MSLGLERSRLGILLAGAAMLAALAIAQAGGSLDWVAIMLAIAGSLASVTLLAPRLGAAFRRRPELVFVVVLIGLGALWVVLGVHGLDRFGRTLTGFYGPRQVENWPWRIGHVSLLPLVLMLVSAATALVLIADAVRLRLGFAPRSRPPWREITHVSASPRGMVPRALVGLALLALAVVLAVSLANPYVQGNRGKEILGCF